MVNDVTGPCRGSEGIEIFGDATIVRRKGGGGRGVV